MRVIIDIILYYGMEIQLKLISYVHALLSALAEDSPLEGLGYHYTSLVWYLPKTTLALGPSEKTIQIAMSPLHPPYFEPHLCYYLYGTLSLSFAGNL